MELVDDYGGDDKAAMAANVTSGFNCRFVDGTDRWSNHAFGLAVDINPLQAMSIITFYKFNKQNKEFEFDRTHMMEDWNTEGGQASLAWAEGMYRDMFYK